MIGDDYKALKEKLNKSKSNSLRLMFYTQKWQEKTESAVNFFLDKEYSDPKKEKANYANLEKKNICALIFYIGMCLGTVFWFIYSLVELF